MKKFLSLVLALIMTMSLVTIGAGATEYRDLTDKDEIQYEEAVAVLNRIGVITGYEDGSFRPETELTRGAAAKIIVSLLIGPEAAANLPNATAPYPDVPASHTFAGVISYCKTAGIISGYGDGTFKPANSLTGFAFAKMLLGALGYKSEIEGFVDTGWTMNVARIGNVTGLFDRLDFDGSAAVNREVACQLALNTLKATMVTYGGTTLVTGAQTLAVQGTQAMYVTSNNREINANINRRVINATNNEMTLEFGEEHFKDLRLEHDKYDPAYDVYGHPSNEWSWKKVTIGTFPLPADFTFTKQMSHLEDTIATKEKALGLRNYDTWSTDHRANYTNWSSAAGGTYAYNSPFDDATQITINGWNARVNSETGRISNYDAGDFNGASKKPTGVPTIAEIADLTDNGVTVEVYVCPVDADFITNVVVTRTQLMKVKRLGSDYVTLEDVKPDSRDPRKDSDLKKITGYNAFAIDVTEDYDSKGKGSYLADVKDSNYDAYNALKDMKAGDYVAVVPYTTDNGKTWEVGEAYAPETVSGAFTKVDTYANVNKPAGSAVAITVGGTSYPINEWNKDMLNVTGSKIKATKKDVTLYLAKDGTVLWANEIGNSDAWMVVGDYYQATGTNGKVGWYVHGWTTGGAEVDLDLGTIRGDAEIYAPGELVYYNIAETGNGEYALSKPNSNGVSYYRENSAASYAAKSNTHGEPVWTYTNDKKVTGVSGEGAYEVAQYTFDRDQGKTAPCSIKSRNGALALQNWNRLDTELPEYDTAVLDAGKAQKIFNKSEKTLVVAPHTAEPTEIKYRNVPYDGVKFIFVSFDPANGEVESIEFKSGIQNVDYEDLCNYNKTWRNVGTNVDDFVVTAAEAYVNDKGVVKTVVVKSDSSVADLSRIAVITDTPGDKNLEKTGAEGDRPAGISYAKQYVTGPSFSISEEKTGWFDRDYPIGTILIISEKDNLIVGKYFRQKNYTNGNPDAIFVKGIDPLLRGDNKNSEGGFLVGQSGTVWTQNKTTRLTYGTSAAGVVTGSEGNVVHLLGNKYTVGYDTLNSNTSGLITVGSNTTFVDLRAINNDTIESLGDLLDYDLSTVELRVLVNGAISTDTFRHAYVVIVEKASGKKDDVATPVIDIQAIENNQYVPAKTGSGAAKDPWVFEVEANKQVRLHGVFKNAADLTGKVEKKTWIVNDRVIEAVSDNDSIYVDAPEVIGSADGKLVSWTVAVRDDSKTGIRAISSTVYAKVVIKGGATVTVTPAEGGTIAPAAGLNVGDTFTLTPAAGYEYVSVVGATKAADSMTFTITGAAVTITMKKAGEEPATKEIAITGTAGQTVTFKNQAGETVATAAAGASTKLPTGTYLCAEAATGYYARVEKDGTAYNRYFKTENVTKIEVYAKGDEKWEGVYNADGDTVGLGKIPAPAGAAAAASAQADEMSAVSVQNAADSKIMISDPGSDAYLLCEPGAGLNAGMYFVKTGYAVASMTAVLKAMNAAADAGDLITEISDDRFNQGYTDTPVPVEPSETVQAKYADSKYSIYSYGAKAVTEEEAIAAALAAQNKRAEGGTAAFANTKYDTKTGVLTYDVTNNGAAVEAQTLTIVTGTAKNSGSITAPKALYKVTVGAAGAVYVAENDYIESVTEGTFIRESDVWTSSTVTANEANGLRFTAAMKPDDDANGNKVYDVKLVPATQITGDVSASTVGTDTAGTLNGQGQVQYGTGAAKTITGLESTLMSNYIAIGAKLTLYVNLNADTSKTFVVNGKTQVKAENKGTTSAVIKLDPITVALNDNDVFVISEEDRIQIKLNGELLTNTDGTTLFDGAPSALKLPGAPASWTGLSVAKVSKEGLYSDVASGDIVAATVGAVEATANVSSLSATTGVLELYSGYNVGKPTNGCTISNTKTPGSTGSVKIAQSDTNSGFVTCKPGATTATLYVTGAAATEIEYAAAEASRKISDLTVVTEPTAGAGGVYSFKVKGDVAFAVEFSTVTYTAPSVRSYVKGPTVNLSSLSGTRFALTEVTYTYAPLEGDGKFTAVSDATAFGGTASAPTVTLAGSDDTSATSAECGVMTITAKHGKIVFTVTQNIKTTGKSI